LLRLRQLADSRNDPKFYEFRLNPFPKLITATVIASEAKQSLWDGQTAVTATVIAEDPDKIGRRSYLPWASPIT
jgi:hypothetical protein